MSRFLLLFVFVLWMAAPVDHEPVGARQLAAGAAEFVGVYAAGLVAVRLLGGRVARRVGSPSFFDARRRFVRVGGAFRFFIPAWFAAGLYVLHWGTVVRAALNLTPLGRWPVELPGVVVGSLPAMLAWCGLWWSTYPAERAAREQNLLFRLDDGLPVHAPPPFWVYFRVNLRLQLLFVLAPLLVLVAARDLLGLTLPPLVRSVPALSRYHVAADTVESAISVLATALMFVFAPELLRRVLRTEPLPDDDLRRRLESIARQNKIRFRDVLLWHTEHNTGNAAAMGLVPFARYILISDLLLESMPREQVEAVFAHEIGHVRHRHLWWLVVFFGAMMFALTGTGMWADDLLGRAQEHGYLRSADAQTVLDGGLMVCGVAAFAVSFGFISRKFERQADVFAARVMERQHGGGPDVGARASATAWPAAGTAGGAGMAAVADANRAPSPAGPSRVGPTGAAIVGGALRRVAFLNSIPIAARSWDHGSILRRVDYLTELGDDPGGTRQFDRLMRRLYVALFVALVGFGAWTAFAATHFGGGGANGESADADAAAPVTAIDAKP